MHDKINQNRNTCEYKIRHPNKEKSTNTQQKAFNWSGLWIMM